MVTSVRVSRKRWQGHGNENNEGIGETTKKARQRQRKGLRRVGRGRKGDSLEGVGQRKREGNEGNCLGGVEKLTRLREASTRKGRMEVK
jgi:hypothetical protein